jgi:hypothetical protein
MLEVALELGMALGRRTCDGRPGEGANDENVEIVLEARVTAAEDGFPVVVPRPSMTLLRFASMWPNSGDAPAFSSMQRVQHGR